MKPIVTEPGEGIGGSAERFPSTGWALGSLALSMLLSSLGTSIATVALPTMAQVFTASFQEVQWIIIAYLLTITVMIVSVGRLGDIMGHRRVLLVGILLFTVASFLCGIAPNLWVLIVMRGVQGLGAAILMALTVALIRQTVPKEKTGRAMGLLGTMSAIGTTLGPSLGGLLIAGLGWRAIFLVLVPLGILNFFLTYRFLPAQEQIPNNDRKSFDNWGTLLLGLTLAAYALAVTTGGGEFDWVNIILLLAAVLSGILFALVQARVASPLIQLSLFRNVMLMSSLTMNLLVATVMMATLVVGPFYLSQTLGLEPALVGFVMSIGPIFSALSGVPAGRIVDRLGAPFMIVIGLVTMAVGAFALSSLPALFGLAGYVAAMVMLTPGYQLFQAANSTAVMIDVSSDQRGVISGLLSLSRNLGLITGASVMGAVFAFASKTTNITTAHPEAVATGMQITFSAATVLIIIALGVAVGSRVLAIVQSKS